MNKYPITLLLSLFRKKNAYDDEEREVEKRILSNYSVQIPSMVLSKILSHDRHVSSEQVVDSSKREVEKLPFDQVEKWIQ